MNRTKAFKLKIAKEYFYLTAGALLFSAGTYFFKLPNNFSFGGISGAAPILSKIAHLSPATWISIMTCLCLLIGFAFLDRKAGINPNLFFKR